MGAQNIIVMNMKKELEILKSHMGGKDNDAFMKQADFIRTNFTSDAEQKEFDNFIETELSEISNKTENLIKETEIRIQLMDVKEIVSLSYIAKQYFHKTRSWLHQKINGNLKNGKPSKFTNKELDTLNFALQDISKKLGSITIRIEN